MPQAQPRCAGLTRCHKIRIHHPPTLKKRQCATALCRLSSAEASAVVARLRRGRPPSSSWTSWTRWCRSARAARTRCSPASCPPCCASWTACTTGEPLLLSAPPTGEPAAHFIAAHPAHARIFAACLLHAAVAGPHTATAELKTRGVLPVGLKQSMRRCGGRGGSTARCTSGCRPSMIAAPSSRSTLAGELNAKAEALMCRGVSKDPHLPLCSAQSSRSVAHHVMYLRPALTDA